MFEYFCQPMEVIVIEVTQLSDGGLVQAIVHSQSLVTTRKKLGRFFETITLYEPLTLSSLRESP